MNVDQCYNISMKARYKYRFYPTDQQKKLLSKLFGCVRVVWNDALALCRQSEKLPKNKDLQKLCITQAKKIEERSWLSEVSSVPLQQSVIDLGVAYKNYFESRTGERKGPKVGPPRFKKKDSKQTARFNNNAFAFKDAKVYLAKIGELKTVWSRVLPQAPTSVTVIKDAAGRYFLSFVVEVQAEIKAAKNESVGIDLGLKTFAVLSNNEIAESPDYSGLVRKVRRAQRQMARRDKGSKRRSVARLRVAKLNAKIADKRKDFLHKLSTKIVSENQTIVLEDLNVAGMLKNRHLSRAISFAGWREFRMMCEAKSEKFDRNFVVLNRWEPTSQICSDCNYRWGKLGLGTRTIVCMNCGSIHDRDGNAAKNIEAIGAGHAHDVKRTGRECKTSKEAVFNELSTRLEAEHLKMFAC
jgi:putative transposase